MAEEKEVKWPIKDVYAKNVGCDHWPWPFLKGWIPCRFPVLKMAGSPPCDLCWRKFIEDFLLRVKGGSSK